MKVNESFAVEATKEVRKDKRFEWYVNWLRSLENEQHSNDDYDEFPLIGVDLDFSVENLYYSKHFDTIITLNEVYSRYGKEIYEANGIEQPFQGSREYDEKLWKDWTFFYGEQPNQGHLDMYFNWFLNNRYQNESILKQIAEKENKSLDERISDFYLAFLGSHDQNDIDNFKSMIYEIIMEKEQRLKNLKSS